MPRLTRNFHARSVSHPSEELFRYGGVKGLLGRQLDEQNSKLGAQYEGLFEKFMELDLAVHKLTDVRNLFG